MIIITSHDLISVIIITTSPQMTATDIVLKPTSFSVRAYSVFVKVSAANISFVSDPITILFSLLCFAVAS